MGPQDRLIEYVNGHRNSTFQLGKHDCFTFTNGAWQAIYGEGYADHMIGRYSCTAPKRFKQMLLDEFGHVDIIDCFDAHLTRVSGIPPRGALVVSSQVGRWIIGKALGIAMGAHAVFVGDKGVIYATITDIDGAWVK